MITLKNLRDRFIYKADTWDTWTVLKNESVYNDAAFGD